MTSVKEPQQNTKIQFSPVDIFIVGQPKSGTTALAHFLDQHPEISVSRPKEPHYFATDLIQESDDYHGGKRRHFEVRTKKQYRECFSHAEPGSLTCDASTHYLASKEAAKNIYQHNPAAKIIILLREPVSFLHSLHQQYVNNGSEDEPCFETALKKEPLRKKGRALPKNTRCPSHHYYSERVKYAEHIKRFLEYFPQESILILLNEEFAADNLSTYQQVALFLGIDTGFTPEFSHVHGTKAPRYQTIHRILNNAVLKQAIRTLLGPQKYDKTKHMVVKLFLKKEPRAALDKSLQQNLKRQFASEVKELERLLHRKDISRMWQY